MTSETQRAQSVRPFKGDNLQPVYEDERTLGEVDAEGVEQGEEVVPTGEQHQSQDGEWPKMDGIGKGGKVIDIDTRPVWEKMQEKVEKLTDRVAEYFDDNNKPSDRKPNIIKAPLQPTTTEYEQHQATHTP